MFTQQVSVQHQMDVLNSVREVATLAGLKTTIDEQRMCVVCGFCLPNGRTQQVYIRYGGATGEGKDVVTFFSPCLVVKNGFMSGISKSMALELLARNEQILFARFGIWRSGDADLIVASADQLLDTMDPEEFASLASFVAVNADSFEQANGGDQY